jgi:hypothetical protein
MTNVTDRLGLPYPDLDEGADGPAAIQALAEALDGVALVDQGALASRPVSTPGSPGIVGRLYRTTDQTPNRIWFDYGTGWVDWHPLHAAEHLAGGVDPWVTAWTPYTPATITGWAATPTVACQYLRIGTKSVFVNVYVNGVSNSTGIQISAPALGNSKQEVRSAGGGVNSTSYIPTIMSVPAGASPLMQIDAVGATWTSVGLKTVWSQIIYELA